MTAMQIVIDKMNDAKDNFPGMGFDDQAKANTLQFSTLTGKPLFEIASSPLSIFSSNGWSVFQVVFSCWLLCVCLQVCSVCKLCKLGPVVFVGAAYGIFNFSFR